MVFNFYLFNIWVWRLYSSNFLGRVIGVICCCFGIFMLSILIITFMLIIQFNEEQYQVRLYNNYHRHIKLSFITQNSKMNMKILTSKIILNTNFPI